MSFFDSAYIGTPPWDIGKPQSEVVRLAEANEIKGRVLDVGCGTGENALYLGSLGFEVWGIDASRLAIEKAIEKAKKRGTKADFLVLDALKLQLLQIKFDTVVDCGLFHVFSDGQRLVFVASLASVIYSGGKYLMLCFNEYEPGQWGPRRVMQSEIRETFKEGWQIDYIREAAFETNTSSGQARAWLSSITRL